MAETPAPAPAEGLSETPAPAPKKTGAVVRPKKPRTSATGSEAPSPAAAARKPRIAKASERPSPARAGGAEVPAPPAGPPATVVDASGLVLGRAASLIAQRLLRGESIVVVHAERSVVVGARPMVLEFYRANRARGSKRTGPHYPRYPDRIFRRTVRGMLPHRKTRGREAFERLRVFIGCPEGYRAAVPDWAAAAKARPALRPPMPLAEISKLLGARL